jgi:hypothetical protein
MKKRVYLETSIISYLTSRPSRDLVTAANQQISHEWWERRHLDFELVASRYVWVEAAAGDPRAAAERLALLAGIVELPMSGQVELLADVLCAQGIASKGAHRCLARCRSGGCGRRLPADLELHAHRQRRDAAPH